VEGNPVFLYHDTFNPDRSEVEDLKERYRAGTVGDVEVKEKLAAALNRFLDPIRERRAALARRKGLVDEVIHAGTLRMREEARETLARVRQAMGIAGVWNGIRRKAERRMEPATPEAQRGPEPVQGSHPAPGPARPRGRQAGPGDSA
jgi:tryptophanyl-tRNA synthetase